MRSATQSSNVCAVDSTGRDWLAMDECIKLPRLQAGAGDGLLPSPGLLQQAAQGLRDLRLVSA